MKKISTNTKTIILSDGDLPSLLVAAMEAEQMLRAPRGGLGDAAVAPLAPAATEPSESGGEASVSVMPWPSSLAVHEVQVEAARSHAGYFDLELLVPCMPWPGMLECNDSTGTPLAQLAEGLNQTLELVSAIYSAMAAGASRVIWPIHFQNDTQTLAQDLEAIADAVDKALLIGRLGLLEHSPQKAESLRQDITIGTPLVDLTSRQLADLVVDMDIPVHLAWWCRSQPTRGDRTGIASQRKAAWLDVLTQAGWIQSGPVTIQSAVRSTPITPITPITPATNA